MKLKDIWEREKKGIVLIIYIIVLFGLALAVRDCVSGREYDEEYEEYLNDVYGGASRYDPV